jgi:predicted DNA binding CopG/RHH family protein
MKNIPKFKTEEEESIFWSKTDSTEVLDWSKAQLAVMPNLKPSLKSISIRIPETLLARLKQEANKLDIPYQSYMKMLLNDGLERRYLGR